MELRVWGRDGIDDNTIRQAEMCNRLPIMAGPVALMPDAHVGIGATVGSVIVTKNAIIPAAVGVDIGCFPGDTLIPLLDGKDHPIKELEGQVVCVYVVTPEHKVTVAKAAVKLTRKDAELVAVTLDTGVVVRCTPDQLFMLRDGTYKVAEQLTPGQSLMPLYLRKDDSGYMQVQQPIGGRWQTVHWVVGRSGLLGPIPHARTTEPGDQVLIHHKAFMDPDGQANNLPESLQFMTFTEHSTLHREIKGGWANEDADFQEKRHAGIARRKADPAQQVLMAEVGANNWRAYNATSGFREMTALAGQRGREFLIQYNQSERGRQVSSDTAQRELTCPHCGKTGRSGFFYRWHFDNCRQVPVNHQVVAVEYLTEREDVYCLTVPDYHNFALSAGVFVHNCGMIAVETSLNASDLPDSLEPWVSQVGRSIPAGVGRERKVDINSLTGMAQAREAGRWMSSHPHELGDLKGRALQQLGTLGSGNHFVEVCTDERGRIWVVLHSGSRGVGNRLADRHIKLAKAQHQALEDPDLSFFLEGTPEFMAYVDDMLWAQAYAMTNRRLMMDAALTDLFSLAPGQEVARINCHHNFAQQEWHTVYENGRLTEGLVWVTRKGAIRAELGDMGVIPGSMATGSFIVRGKQNTHSYNSASHGAGRRMSRTQARKTLTTESLVESMRGIAWNGDAKGLLDEHRDAYKDLNTIMTAQDNLVAIVHSLKTVANYKGS